MSNQITAGKYRAKAKGHQWGRSKNGNEFVRLDFEFTTGAVSGQHITWDGFFTEKTQERTIESLEYCGWEGGSLKDLRGLGSKEVELAIELESYEGTEYARVKWVNEIRGDVKVQLDTGGVAALEQRLKGLMLQRKQKRDAAKPIRESGDDHDDDFGPMNYGDEPPV